MSNKHLEKFMLAVLGEGGSSALKKAVERQEALEAVLAPRVILGWSLAAAHWGYEGSLPGIPDSHISISKGEPGTVIIKGDSFSLETSDPYRLAATISFCLNVPPDVDPEIESLDLNRLGKSIDVLVKSRLLRSEEKVVDDLGTLSVSQNKAGGYEVRNQDGKLIGDRFSSRTDAEKFILRQSLNKSSGIKPRWDSFEQMQSHMKQRQKEQEDKIPELVNTTKGSAWQSKNGGYVVVGIDPHNRNQWRATVLSEQQEPSHHIVAPDHAGALRTAHKELGVDLTKTPYRVMKKNDTSEVTGLFKSALDALDPEAGYTFSHKHQDMGGGKKLTRIDAHSSDGEHVGTATFTHGSDKHIVPGTTVIDDEHQKQGLDAAMHSLAEKLTDKKIVPASELDKVELPGQMAAPREQKGPDAPVSPTHQVTKPQPKKLTAQPVKAPPRTDSAMPAIQGLKVTKSESLAACHVCGGRQFQDSEFVGCVCFSGLAKSVTAVEHKGDYVLKFNEEWSEDAVHALLESFKGEPYEP